MRVFVVHDEEGNIISVAQFEELSAQVDRPFHVTNPKHVLVELDREDEGFKAVAADRAEGRKKGLLKAHSEFAVETRRGGVKNLVKKEGRIITPAPDNKAPTPGPVPPGRQPLPKAPTPEPPEPPRPKGTPPGETPPTRPVPEAEEM